MPLTPHSESLKQVTEAINKEYTMTNTMNKEIVLAAIAAKNTKISTVSFIKADGTIRVINGLFKATSTMVGSELGVKQGLAMAARGQVAIYELASKHWKSFYADKVVAIT